MMLLGYAFKAVARGKSVNAVPHLKKERKENESYFKAESEH